MVVACRALRAVAGNRIVRAASRIVRLHAADGDDKGVVARSRNGSVAVAAIDADASEVAGRHHHCDARVPGLFHGLAKRIIGITAGYWAPQRKVDDLDVVGVLQGNRALNGGDNVAVRPRAQLIQNAKVDQLDPIVNSPPQLVGIGTISSQNSRDVRAMTVGVINYLTGSVLVAGPGKVLVVHHS